MFLTVEKIFFAGWFENFSSFKMCIQDRVFSLVWIAFLLTTTGIHLVTSEEGKLVNSWVTLNPRLPCAVTIVFMFIFFLV